VLDARVAAANDTVPSWEALDGTRVGSLEGPGADGVFELGALVAATATVVFSMDFEED